MLCKFWDVHLTHICAKDCAACSEEGWLFHCRAGLPPCRTGVSLRSLQRFCVSMQLVHPTFPACQGSRGRAAYVVEKQLYFNRSPGEHWVRYHPTLETWNRPSSTPQISNSRVWKYGYLSFFFFCNIFCNIFINRTKEWKSVLFCFIFIFFLILINLFIASKLWQGKIPSCFCSWITHGHLTALSGYKIWQAILGLSFEMKVLCLLLIVKAVCH